MPKYAVKIGEIILQSDKPITQEEQDEARSLLFSREVMRYTSAGTAITYVLDKR